MFTQEEKIQLFNRLPALELSYEPKLHKKVYSPLYYIIPKGPKALVWYTYWGEQHVCLLVLLNERGNYSDIKVFPACFSDALALGTIIYGTHFISRGGSYFTCEQLYYYKGRELIKSREQKNASYLERLQLLVEMFQKEVEQVAYTTNSLIVGLPLMTETYEEALAIIDELPYKAYGIGIGGNPIQPPGGCAPPAQQTPLGKNTFSTAPNSFSKNTPQNKVGLERTNFPFKGSVGGVRGEGAQPPGGCRGAPPKGVVGAKPLLVKADLAADTYKLYDPKDNSFVGIAMVPTYKCSVFLNGLFRNIKENTNLDLLEESDDEDEFENIQLDKFVDLEKSFLMECVFLKKFQKWQPVKLIKM